MNKYEYIFNNLSRRGIPPHKIDELKDYFADEINSKRSYCKINTLLDLLNILQKRSALNNDTNLNHIIQVVDSTCCSESTFHAPSQPTSIPPQFTIIHQLDDDDPILQIHSLIKNDIGSKWKEFARALRISEGRIQDLERHHCRDISEIVEEILQYHLNLNRRNPDLWRSILQSALQRARRTDLSFRIDEILVHRFNYQRIPV